MNFSSTSFNGDIALETSFGTNGQLSLFFGYILSFVRRQNIKDIGKNVRSFYYETEKPPISQN